MTDFEPLKGKMRQNIRCVGGSKIIVIDIVDKKDLVSAVQGVLEEINEWIETDKIFESIYENGKDTSNFWYCNGSREAQEHTIDIIKKWLADAVEKQVVV